jgi:hypothetical protein
MAKETSLSRIFTSLHEHSASREGVPQLHSITTGSTRDAISIEHNKPARLDFEDIDPEPLKRRPLVFEHAHMLATMPRNRSEILLHPALWSAIATATSGIAGLYDILSDKPAQPKMLDLSEIGIFLVCVTATLGVLSRRVEETSIEYLNRLYDIRPAIRRRWYNKLFKRPARTDATYPPA